MLVCSTLFWRSFVARERLNDFGILDWEIGKFRFQNSQLAIQNSTGPVVQWIVRKSPELDIPVRFWAGLLKHTFVGIKITESLTKSLTGKAFSVFVLYTLFL
jgi:hypothetical protein